MRLIDADAVIEKEERSELDRYIDGERCYQMVVPSWAIIEAPTIDAVSVVRCKDCKHKYQEPWNNGVAVEGECEIWHNATLDNDFCSYGERKESE